MTYAEIAAKTGLSASGVSQAARRYGLTRKQMSHKAAIPWQVEREHRSKKVHKYLRDLSTMAQGGKVDPDSAATAFRWAERLIERELDIDYDKDEPPNDESVVGGFFVKPADAADWRLRKVLDRAKRGRTRKL
ncbi:hypothetical protein [Actinomadura oligospora]|uniref:hypothetical protein n=1 Tax=Actinomadura oligospora TaxID=111804 RepID=UPI0012FA9358|nr:hypothetical protein [Actinomadura oligospora]